MPIEISGATIQGGVSVLPPPPGTGNKVIFGYGWVSGGPQTSVTNLVTNLGVVGNDVTGVGTARTMLAAAGYGGDKAIFGFGSLTPGGTNTNITNLVSNTGVVANDNTGAGTNRAQLSAAGYGGDKAIFGFASGTLVSNLISNTGVVAGDVAGVGGPRNSCAGATYGTDKAIFAFGNTGGYPDFQLNTRQLVSNTGVVAGNSGGVGTERNALAAAGYGTDKAIFGYGSSTVACAITNLVSNTGVVASDQAALTGTIRTSLAAAVYGTDKAIFGYGNNGATYYAITNLVSNTGVVATDTAGVGTARAYLAGAAYG